MRLYLRSVLSILGIALLVIGCDDSTSPPEQVSQEDLAPPLGLTSVTGDGQVTLTWQASNFNEDRQGFFVYVFEGNLPGTPETIPTGFARDSTASVTSGVEGGIFTGPVDGLENGTTYSFLVVGYKDNGSKISRPSNIVIDTPRRESGTIDLVNGAGNLRYVDVDADPIVASVTGGTTADILCQSFNAGAGDRPGIVGQNNARIQDLGYVANWDQIDKAPLGGGSYPDATFSVQALPGHVYAIFTGTNHYAKLLVTQLHGGDLGYTCRIAYQPQVGSNELKPR
jgi:hypothetical protein